MSLKLKFRTRANRDLRAIVLYIAKQNGDFVIADRFGQPLVACCEGLLKAPGKGKPRLSHPGTRKLNEGAYKIIYQVTSTDIVIMRIWDGRRGRNPRI